MAVTAAQARSLQRQTQSPARRSPLTVLEGRRRRRPRRAVRSMVVVAVLLAVGSPLAVVGAQAYLTQGQVRLAHLQKQLNAQLSQHRDLELRVAQLEQPANVLSEAQKQGLVVPGSVTALPQVSSSTPQGTTTSSGTSQGTTAGSGTPTASRSQSSPSSGSAAPAAGAGGAGSKSGSR